MADPARIAAELLVAQRAALVKAVGDEVDHCILFSRIAVDVARKRGVLARPMPVSVDLQGEMDPKTPLLLGLEGRLPPDAPPDA